MHSIIRAAFAAALAFLIVPQVAFGLAKPCAAPHPDTAPIEAQAAPASAAMTRASLSAPEAGILIGDSGGSNSMAFTWLTDGDIVVVLDPSSITGHAGLFDRSHYSGILSYSVLSANVAPVDGVQYEKCAKYRLYEWAYALRVPQEYSHRVAVRDYAARQLGKPYSVLASKTDLRSFYCSKLPWVAYHNVTGVDLDGDGGFWVWPVDLITSRYTNVVGYWG
jgi:cell wall-associated NlpC family hydrolase